MMRSACVRSCSTHQARSSNAATSNSKLLNDGLDRKPVLALLCLYKAALHRFGFQQIRCFTFRFNFPPELDGHDDGGRLTILVGNDLDFGARHDFSVPLPDLNRPRPPPVRSTPKMETRPVLRILMSS